jgi:glycosyltransferase involved in cell wall biosynthesis
VAGERPPRILHVPLNVGGNPAGLARAERELGLHSDVVVLARDPFRYEADRTLATDEMPLARAAAQRLRLLAHAVRSYDVFHFNYGSTIVPVWRFGLAFDELPLLKRVGKTVLATFQGSDARPPSCWPPAARQGVSFAAVERRQRHSRRRLLRFADRVFYLNPDLREWLPGAQFRPYASVDPRTLRPVPPRQAEELLVVHAPSKRRMKGTAAVVAAVDRLRAEGEAIKLDLVEGVPRREALERTADADVAIDQLELGWYGGFALEAMALGKPVLCQIRDERPGDNPFGDELPVVRTAAGTLAADLRALIRDPKRLAAAGLAGRRFVEAHHDPRRVARSTLEGVVALPAEPIAP